MVASTLAKNMFNQLKVFKHKQLSCGTFETFLDVRKVNMFYQFECTERLLLVASSVVLNIPSFAEVLRGTCRIPAYYTVIVQI